MLWLDDPSSGEDSLRRKRSIFSNSIQFFSADQNRIKQRARRRQQRQSIPSIEETIEESIAHPYQHNNTLTSSSSSCSINQTFNHSKMNRSLSCVGSIASSTCLSSASSTTRRLPRKHSLKQLINQPNQRFMRYIRSVACLESRRSILIIDSEDEQTINQSNDGSCCQRVDCLSCSALTSSSCASPSNPDQVHYLSDPESRPFFDQTIKQTINQKPLLLVPSVQSIVSMSTSSQLAELSTRPAAFSHVMIDIPNDDLTPITITVQASPAKSQCYQSNALMSPSSYVIDVPLLAHSPINMFSGMQFAASFTPIKQPNNQTINQFSPRYEVSLEDSESCGPMVRSGCLCLVLGLVVLIASLYFLPLMDVSSFIHVVGFALPVFTIVLALYACVCADRTPKAFHLNVWLALGAFDLFAHVALAYDCILPFVLSTSLSLEPTPLRAAFSLGTVVLMCSALLGLTLLQVSHWKDHHANLMTSPSVRPAKQLKRPQSKPIKHAASLADLRSLLIERTRLRKQRRSLAKVNGVIRSKEERPYDSEQSPLTD